MEVTVRELEHWQPESYRMIDMRNAESLAYGTISGAESRSAESLLEAPPENDGKRLVLVCARGQFSLETALELEARGYAAYSLTGGYLAWLRRQMEKQDADELCARVETSLRKRFREKLWCNFTKAIRQYALVKPGDRIAVCISGGKDSMLMAKLFQELKLHNKFPFELRFLVMDPGYSPANRQIIEENARRLHIPIETFETEIFDSVYNVEKSPCYLCARMRRGYLYSFAKKLGCNKIALGHHYDDVIETILMGMLWGAQVQTMMPKLHSTNFEGMELIRPLYLIREDDIKAWRDANELHFIQCACKFTDTCTTCRPNEETKSKRLQIKQLIRELKKTNPEVEAHIFRSMENVCLDTVLAYKTGGRKVSFLDGYDEKMRKPEAEMPAAEPERCM